MSMISEPKTKVNDLKLLEDLERRFGPAMAQDIMDQIKKAESKGPFGTVPDYMGVKALSEGMEIYRQETLAALKRLKTSKIADWDDALLQAQFERNFGFYARFRKGYFLLYRQAMAAYKVKGIKPLYGKAA